MKRLFVKVLLAVMLLVVAVPVHAFTPKIYLEISAVKTADAVILAAPGWLYKIIVHTDGSNAVTMTLYDNATTNSGTKFFGDWVVTTSSIDRTQVFTFNPPLPADNGMYADITLGAGAMSFVVYYKTK